MECLFVLDALKKARRPADLSVIRCSNFTHVACAACAKGGD